MNLYRCFIVWFITQSLSVSAYTAHDYQVVGKGHMRWLMLNLYEARLLSNDGNYIPNQTRVALEITYKKRFSKSSLLSATKNEWQRMGAIYSNEWLECLDAIWPDVADNDVLTFHINSTGVSTFYFNQTKIGTIPDQKFGPVFLSIWLSEKSRNQSLRNRLLGKISGN